MYFFIMKMNTLYDIIIKQNSIKISVYFAAFKSLFTTCSHLMLFIIENFMVANFLTLLAILLF